MPLSEEGISENLVPLVLVWLCLGLPANITTEYKRLIPASETPEELFTSRLSQRGSSSVRCQRIWKTLKKMKLLSKTATKQFNLLSIGQEGSRQSF